MAGDGSLQNIQQEAMKLFQVVLSCPVGAQRAVYDSQGGKSYSKFLAVKRWALLKFKVLFTKIFTITLFRKERELYTKCIEVEAEVKLCKFLLYA